MTTEKPFVLSDVRGKVVLLNFWGTWCSPCLQELPDLIALQTKYAPRGFTIVGLAENDDPRLTEAQYRVVLSRFMQKNGINYPNVPIPEGVKSAYGIEAFPTTFLIDKTGKIVYATVGPVDTAEVEKRIENLLSK